MSDNELTHIVGTFLIQAEGAFLNGAGLAEGEDRNVVVPKTFSDIAGPVPYVSAQAWKRWLRETFKEENPNEPHAELVQMMKGAKGSTSKIGTEMDPVEYPEDDIFGYMRATKGQGRVAEDEVIEEAELDTEEEAEDTKSKGKEKVKAVMRAAPFAASILTSVRRTGWKGEDEGFVHLKEGTPLPSNRTTLGLKHLPRAAMPTVFGQLQRSNRTTLGLKRKRLTVSTHSTGWLQRSNRTTLGLIA